MLDGKLKFMERILTESERNVAKGLKGSRLTEFVAGRFAAKEAYSKSGRDWYRERSEFLDIEVRNDDRGKPILITSTEHIVHLSISHSKEFAVAQVVLESSSR